MKNVMKVMMATSLLSLGLTTAKAQEERVVPYQGFEQILCTLIPENLGAAKETGFMRIVKTENFASLRAIIDTMKQKLLEDKNSKRCLMISSVSNYGDLRHTECQKFHEYTLSRMHQKPDNFNYVLTVCYQVKADELKG